MEFGISTLSPLDFKLNFNHNHSYTDDKKTSMLTTTVIKDKFGDIIKNGTLVCFLIKSGYNTFKIYKKTINGIAQIKYLQPKKVLNFEVLAFIREFAKSDVIKIEYKANNL